MGIKRVFQTLALVARSIIGLIAGGLLIWSLYWVASRSWRHAEMVGDQVELTIMHWAGEGGQEEDQIVKSLLRDFESRHPHIRVKRINPGDSAGFYTKLQTMMAAGEAPDVFYVGSERVANFAGKGLLLNLDEFVSEGGGAQDPETLDLSDFYEATVDCFRFDGVTTGKGSLYGIPKDFTTIGFYYNKDLFDRAGLRYPWLGWTWDDFVYAAREIGKLEDCTGAEFVTWPVMIRLYLWTYGLDVCSPDFEEIRLREPAVMAALEQLRSWRHDEENTLTSGKSKVAAGASVFLTGRVGMAGPFGRWVVPSYRSIESFDWDFAPLPRGTVKANAVATVAWAISQNTSHPEEAWALVRHLCGPEGQAMAVPLGLAVPTLRSVANSSAFINPEMKPESDQIYLEQTAYARAVPWPANPKFEARLASRLDQALKTGDKTLDEAIALFEKDWEFEKSSPLARADHPPMPWRGILLGMGIPVAVLAVIGFVGWYRRRPGKLEFKEELAGYMLISPWVIGFATFMAFPIILSLLLMFTSWNGVSTLNYAKWVGFGNLSQLLFYDGRFRTCVWVTVYYAALAVPLGQLLALGAAMLMSNEIKGIGFFRSAWYLPSVLAGVGVAVLWRWVFDGDNGLLNALLAPVLDPFGLEPPNWFDDDAAWFGPPAFAIMSLWTIGGSMMIYLAGLNGIPKDLYEAASIDGSGWFGRFRNVTLPMLSPVIFFNFIMAVIASFQVFTQSYVMTGGEPGDLTRFYVLYLYNQAFDFHEMGYASAMAWILLLIILGLTLITMRGSRRYVYYEGLQG